MAGNCPASNSVVTGICAGDDCFSMLAVCRWSNFARSTVHFCCPVDFGSSIVFSASNGPCNSTVEGAREPFVDVPGLAPAADVP